MTNCCVAFSSVTHKSLKFTSILLNLSKNIPFSTFSSNLSKKLVVQFIVKFLLITSPTDKENIDRFLGYLIGHSTVDEKMVAVGQSDTLKTYDSLMFKLFKIYLAGDLDSYTKLAAENAEEISKLGRI